MSVLSKLTKRLAELDDERGRTLIAIQMVKAIEGGGAAHHAAPLAKALARVNGHQAAPSKPSATQPSRDVRLSRIINWLSDGPRRPVTAREVAHGTGDEEHRASVWGALNNLTKRTKFHGKVVKKVGTKWLWIGDKTATAKKAAPPVTATKHRAPSTPAGSVKAAILAYLKKRGAAPTPFIEIRDALRRDGVVSNDSASGRSVSVTLRTALSNQKLVKLTAEGWVYTGE